MGIASFSRAGRDLASQPALFGSFAVVGIVILVFGDIPPDTQRVTGCPALVPPPLPEKSPAKIFGARGGNGYLRVDWGRYPRSIVLRHCPA